MSNASNLSTLANVLDDGSSGQFLKSTGSGGVAFDTVAAGAVVYATADLLPLSGNSAGDMAYVTATNRFYINNGSGWYSISLVNTNPNITSVADASSGTTPFTLATDGTATVVTVTAADPEDIPLTYGYSVTSGSLNGSTVAQGTGSNTNVFTVTPHASQDATFTITFTASDGINQATSANAFSLSFVTAVTDSNHTTLLATATGTSDNNNITDSSSNNHSITVNGDTYAGTFSPYRSGGYSTYFDGTGDYLATTSSNYALGTSGAFTLELWYYLEDARTHTLFDSYPSGYVSGNGEAKLAIIAGGSGGSGDAIYLYGGAEVGNLLSVSRTFSVGVWEHFCWTRDTSGNHTFYINGTQIGTSTATPDIDINLLEFGRRGGSFNSTFMKGYLSDVRLVKGTAITPPSGGPTERLEAVTNTSLLTCHLPYITDGSSNDHSITVNGDVSTKPFSPYDYTEYDAADHGGSVYFDGTGDTLEIPHSTNVGAFGTNDFTVQLWYYTEANGNQDYLIDFRQYGSNGDYLSISKNGSNKIVVAEGGSNRITGTKNIDIGRWFFITVHRDNGSLKLFVNGEQDGNTYADSTNYVAGSSNNFIIGKNNGSASYLMEGYLSDIKVTHGSALDGATVPTAPLSSSGASLHIKGTDASIIDKSQGANLKLVGNTTGSTTQAKFASSKSIYFDGTGDYIDLGSATNFNFGTNSFTIEAWVRFNSLSRQSIINCYDGTDNSFDLQYRDYNNVNHISWSGQSSHWATTPSDEISSGTWYHIAAVRDYSAGTIKIYIDGTQKASASDTRNYSTSQNLIIGAQSNSTGAANINCYIQDLRVSNFARYTANFTPPTAPLEG